MRWVYDLAASVNHHLFCERQIIVHQHVDSAGITFVTFSRPSLNPSTIASRRVAKQPCGPRNDMRRDAIPYLQKMMLDHEVRRGLLILCCSSCGTALLGRPLVFLNINIVFGLQQRGGG